MESYLEQNKSLLKKKFNIIEKFYDFSYSPIIQSGGVYDLRPSADNTKEQLKDDVIILNLGGKYFEYNCNINRTLIINPT